MNTNLDPRELADALRSRSRCRVQVACVLVDVVGRIHSWGWNGMGPDGNGIHAEAHAISRANPKRLAGSIAYVSARWHKRGRVAPSRPCGNCEWLLKINNITGVWYREAGVWAREIFTID